MIIAQDSKLEIEIPRDRNGIGIDTVIIGTLQIKCFSSDVR